MPPRRPYYSPGHYYHIYNRGAGKRPIFRDDMDYLYVIRKIKEHIQSLCLTLISYCLMPNHYHFLILQNGDNSAGLLPQRVFNGYTKAYNKRYSKSGTLFESPYKVIAIDRFDYLLHLCRYIHANPVKDGLIDKLEAWPYSNYLDWIGLRKGTLVDIKFVQDYFPHQGSYQEFVAEYLKTRKIPEELRDYLFDY